MLISIILSVVANVLIYVLGIIFLPFRLLFPSIDIPADSFAGIINFALDTFKNIQNIFIYFSSQTAFRILMPAVIVNFIIVPLIKPVSFAISHLMAWIRTLKP